MINSDYMQYRDYGLRNSPEPEKPPEEPEKNIDRPEPNQSDIIKKHVILPGWLSKKRGKAKL